MKQFAAALAFVLIAGCSPAPVTYHSFTPATGDTVYVCAVRHVNELGYTVTRTGKLPDYFVADRRTSGWTEYITGRRHFDRLTASITQADTTWRKLRITASSVQVRTRVSKGQETTVPTRDKVQEDANTVVTACTIGLTKATGTEGSDAARHL
jgi:hypothetical protein